MKIGVIYASMSGNTEAIADFIAEELTNQGHEVTLKDILSLQSAKEILNYDLTFIGMYTWGDGDYPDECIDIIEELEEIDLDQQPIALFGSGDMSYPEFCGALDKLKELVENQGGIVFVDPLRIEFSPEPKDESDMKKFVSNALSIFEVESR